MRLDAAERSGDRRTRRQCGRGGGRGVRGRGEVWRLHGRVVLTFLWHGMVRMERQLHGRSCLAGITPAFVPADVPTGGEKEGAGRGEIEGSRHELTKIYRRAKYYWVGIVKRKRERKRNVRDTRTMIFSPWRFRRLLVLTCQVDYRTCFMTCSCYCSSW